MIRFGLCCKFFKEPIRFRTTTVTAVSRLKDRDRLQKLDELCLHNAISLLESLKFCCNNNIKAFRINSQILPVKTHSQVGYDIKDLPFAKKIISIFQECGKFAKENDIRLSFHPDQFVVLNSPDKGVFERSVEELCYQAQVAQWVGADVINVHGGGAYGNKKEALGRLVGVIEKLPKTVKDRITLENDDRSYTPKELIPVCQKVGVPFVYDVHHHRCLADGLTVGQVTNKAVKTWGKREPLFHISSPKEGWKGPQPFRHHDFINAKDFPNEWKGLNMTVEVEAKAKEVAILKLQKDLKAKGFYENIAYNDPCRRSRTLH